MFSDEFGKILFTHYTPVVKKCVVSGWNDQRVVEELEKVIKNQINLRHLTGLTKLKLKN